MKRLGRTIIFFSILGLILYSSQQRPATAYAAAEVLRKTWDSEIGSSTDTVIGIDSTLIAPDTTTVTDSLAKDTTGLNLQAQINFETNDSIVVLPGRSLVRLFGDAKVRYMGQDIQGDYMHMQTDSGTIFSTYIDYPDSLKKDRIYARIKTESEEYEAKSITYNFHSARGFISDVVTKQGEGFMTAEKTKRMENEDLFVEDGRYTTCNHHAHPHYYIAVTRGKVRPGKDIVSGPIYLVIADIALPIGLPFAFFPFTTSRASGLIMPSYGDELERGFYLRNGGYYFAINDNVDLNLTGDIYTKGSWALNARSSYIKRYRFSGSIDASYIVTKRGDKVVGDYSEARDFRIAWRHQQDAKANPYRTFSANVNFSTSSYNHNNLDGLYNQAVMGQNTKSSSISFSQRFPDSPWNISGSFDISQRSRDSAIAVTLPNISVTMSRIYPFKRKQAVGAERWYEKISLSYSGQMRNYIDTKENKILKSNLIRDWRNGINHSIPISASFDLFQYFKITPSFNYQERWYLNKIEKAYDPALNKVIVTDTIQGFNRVYDFNASLSLSTTIYGFWKPLPFLGDRINMIRHRMEPSVSISYRPDFGAQTFGYWRDLHYITRDGRREKHSYSPYEGQLFGVPGRGKSGNISFSINNNVEAKIKNKEDSTTFDKVSIIESLSLSSGYNLAADSFQWSDLNASISLRFSDSFTLRLGGAFDLYPWDYHEYDGKIRPYRVDKLRILSGKGIGQFRGTSTSFSYTLNPTNLNKLLTMVGLQKKDKEDSKNTNSRQNRRDPLGEDQEQDPHGGGSLMGRQQNDIGEYDANGYLVNKMDWSFGFNYNISLGWSNRFNTVRKEFEYDLRHDLSFNGSFKPAENWNFNFSANYNFEQKKITNMTANITRQMHCWSMTASFIPLGPFKSYNFSIQVDSQLLQDLRYRKSSQPSYGRGSGWY